MPLNINISINNVSEQNKIYFASDFHLGIPDFTKSRERELLIVKWLDEISKDAKQIYLLGDLFDFWFEYKHTIPKGYVRFLGKLAQLVDSGIEIIVFTGNHDMWMFGYLEKEIGVKIIREPLDIKIGSKKFHIAHGDGLGPGDRSYKFIKKIFSNSFCKWLFARIHPNLGISIANYWSKKSRAIDNFPGKFMGEDKEWLITYCKDKLTQEHYDYFVFGHRHFPIEYSLQENSKYINLGDWLNHYTYAVYDGEKIELNKFV